MIRIVFVEASSGGVVGGSLSGLYHLIRGLDRRRFEVLLVLYEPKQIEAELAAIGVRVRYVRRCRLPKEHGLHGLEGYRRARARSVVRGALRSVRQTARLLIEEIPAALALARIFREEAADVVHLGNGLRANFDGLLAGLATGTPIVCHVKGFEKYGARERWAARRTRTLVCMTRAVLAHCESHGVRAPDARVVYDAVDEAWLCPRQPVATVRESLGVPADAPCVGLVGNIQEWKGQHVLVEAMPLLRSRCPEAHAVLVGGVHRAGAEYEAKLRQQVAAAGLSDCVHFAGFREDVVDVMNAMDVIVHASVRPEPFGRVILEAMLLGKPVVAADGGGVPELIEDGRTGFLVPRGDTARLGQCLQRLLLDRAEGADIGRRGRDFARCRFSLSQQVAEMSGIYDAAADGGRVKRARGTQ